MARTRDPEGFAAVARPLNRAAVRLEAGQQALTHVACMLAAKGGLVADLAVGDCIEFLELARQMRREGHAGSPLFYQLLREAGVLGDDAPATLRVFAGRGQPSCAQLIDRYHLACRPLRDVLVGYLAERQPSVDFSSLCRGREDGHLLGGALPAPRTAERQAACPRRRLPLDLGDRVAPSR
jgi:hypothetical protein